MSLLINSQSAKDPLQDAEKKTVKKIPILNIREWASNLIEVQIGSSPSMLEHRYSKQKQRLLWIVHSGRNIILRIQAPR